MNSKKEESGKPSAPGPTPDTARVNLVVQIQRMSVAERIRLAVRGNREVRGILIRDPVKPVQVAVIKNPRITDAEVERIASYRTIEDEVIRLIVGNREWMKNYAIKLALVKNPRTPVRTSIRFLSHLREKDLKAISQSRDLPNVLVATAKKLLSLRKQRRA